jgi:hypothetical protein
MIIMEIHNGISMIKTMHFNGAGIRVPKIEDDEKSDILMYLNII